MKRNKRVHTLASTLGLLVSTILLPALSTAQELQAQLENPAAKQALRAPGDSLRVRLNQSNPRLLERLAMELDDMDITGLLVVDGKSLVYTPPQPLSWGEHSLRLLEYAPDGSIVEHGIWTFEIRKTVLFREAEARAQINANGSWRISDNGFPNPGARTPDRGQLNGASRVEAVVADGGWQVAGNADFIYNTLPGTMPRPGDQFDLGQYLVTASSGPMSVNIGHHSMGSDNLVMQGFNRRGVSVGAASADNTLMAGAFSMRTEPIVGFQHGLGVSDPDHRIDGAVAVVRPLSSAPDDLIVSGAYLTGEGNQTGVGVGGSSSTTRGEAASVAADGYLFNRRVRLRGEIAATQYDFDGAGTALTPEHDKAYTVLGTYTPWHEKTVSNLPFSWNMGIEHKHIGTFFYSLANPMSIADRDVVRGFTDINWSSLVLQASLGRETDNVSNLDLVPRTETHQYIIASSYSPQAVYDEQGQPQIGWLGQQSYTAQLLRADQNIVQTGDAALLLTPGAYSSTVNLAMAANFTHAAWGWFLNYNQGRFDNYTNALADTDSQLVGIGANIYIGEKLVLTPSVQTGLTDNQDLTTLQITRTRNLTGSLNASYAFTQKLSAGLNYSLNRNRTSDDTVNDATRILTSSLNWIAYQAQMHRPGIAFWLQGQYQDQDNAIFSSATRNNYQVYLGTSVTWSPVY